jgi:hypothetical protein
MPNPALSVMLHEFTEKKLRSLVNNSAQRCLLASLTVSTTIATDMSTYKKHLSLPYWAVVRITKTESQAEHRDDKFVYWRSNLYPTAATAKEAARSHCQDLGLEAPTHFRYDAAEHRDRVNRLLLPFD